MADAQVVMYRRYSYLAQAAYDAYDHGACRYPLRRLLPALGLTGHGYVATKYLYATVDTDEHRQHWIGYIAVATTCDAESFRDIVVVWRGTSAPSELFINLEASLVPIHGEEPPVLVEHGFQSLYVSDELSAQPGPERRVNVALTPGISTPPFIIAAATMWARRRSRRRRGL
ncbi:unnamed protein product [Urochloa humidicola]